MQRQGEQSKKYKTERLQMSISKDEESKLKSAERKYYRWQYAEIGKAN